MQRFLRHAGSAFALILLGASLVAAQTASAVIQGTITDHQGGVLPGVSVTATNTDTGLRRDVASDEQGFFRLAALPPGPYALAAKVDGFAPYARTGLVLTVGQTATIDIPLNVATLSEAVSVTAEAPLIDTATNALGTTVTRQQLDQLPLAGRDFAGLANLAAGVTGVGGGGINAGGQLSRNNSIVVDGTSNDEQGVAGSRGSFSLESVREYVVYTNQFAAEFGQASVAAAQSAQSPTIGKWENRAR